MADESPAQSPKFIRTLTLKFGPSTASAPLGLDVTGTTVFVGPNNSGKSLVLREIEQYVTAYPAPRLKIVSALVPNFPDPALARRLLDARQINTSPTDVADGHIRIGRQLPAQGTLQQWDIPESHMVSSLAEAWTKQSQGQDLRNVWAGVFSHFVASYLITLDGRTRFGLTDQRGQGDLLMPAQNHLAALFKDDTARVKLRGLIHNAFGVHLVVDPTNTGMVRLRMSPRPPTDAAEEQNGNQRARDFHAGATPIEEFSDGVRSYTGILSALVSSDFRLILIDEPEAFLHPPLARTLGRTMTQLAKERSANVFASTHSAHFLVGCLDSGVPLNVVRLTYESGIATARLLPSDRITTLMRDPLLRSTNVLSALFHKGAVVAEGDSDRAFYDEINQRLQNAALPAVIDSAFLNAQNKSTIRRIVEPLRSMGIPAVAIVDFDIIKRRDLNDLLKVCSVPSAVIAALTALCGRVREIYERDFPHLKNGGWRLDLLKGSEKQSCEFLLDQLEAYGVFVVPNGEVQSWLGYLNVVAAKENWLSAIFERLGSDPEASDYVAPAAGDVWEFLGRVATWIADPERYGMP